MRFKPDGTVDEIWREPPAPWWRKTPEPEAERYARSQRPIKTPEQWRERLIDDLLRVYPTLTRVEAAEHIDAVLVF
jgi:hypothetical protein